MKKKKIWNITKVAIIAGCLFGKIQVQKCSNLSQLTL